MKKTIKIGVIGCANIAERFIIPAINNNNKYKLNGVASRSINKAKSYAKVFDTCFYDNYDALINSDIDAVYIPLPNGLHYEWIKKSLDNDLHVLVEKSMACDFKEVKELNFLAQSKGLALMENFQFRFHSQLRYILDEVNSGAIGDIKLLRSCFGFPPFKDKNNIRYQKTIGGGALLDAGAYTIKISQILLGDNLIVKSANLQTPEEYEVEISGSAMLEQVNNGITSQIAFGFNHFYQNNIEIWGSEGKLTANRIFTAGPGVKAEVKIEKTDSMPKLTYFTDNHFNKMLDYFSDLINVGDMLQLEYMNNNNQARLISDVFSHFKKA